MIRVKGKKFISLITIPIIVTGLMFSGPFSMMANATGSDTTQTSDNTSSDEDAKKKEEEAKKKAEEAKKKADMSALEESIKQKESAIASAKSPPSRTDFWIFSIARRWSSDHSRL